MVTPMEVIKIGIDVGARNKTGIAVFNKTMQSWLFFTEGTVFDAYAAILYYFERAQRGECELVVVVEDTTTNSQPYKKRTKVMRDLIQKIYALQPGLDMPVHLAKLFGLFLKEVYMMFRKMHNIGLNAGLCRHFLEQLDLFGVTVIRVTPSAGNSKLNSAETTFLVNLPATLTSKQNVRDAAMLLRDDVIPTSAPLFQPWEKPGDSALVRDHKARIVAAMSRAVVDLQAKQRAQRKGR